MKKGEIIMRLLCEGVWLNKDLAEWFGVSTKTFSNTKKKRLEAHLSIVCESNNGTSFVYSILEE